MLVDELKGIVYNFKRYAVNDGPGIRQTVFFKGCPLSCWWCHNPESQDIKSESSIRKCILDGISFDQTDTIGKLMSVNEVMDEIKKDHIFYDESGGGVTFSGGEPLMQHQFLNTLLMACKESGIHTAVDTTGFANAAIFESIAAKTDLFLYDLKHLDNNSHIKYTGVPNIQILKNLIKLDELNKEVVIRFPVIPKVNNDENNIAEMLIFLKKLKNIRKLTLLPYHTIANHKYSKMNKTNKMEGQKSLHKKDMRALKSKFESIGFQVKIGY